MEKNAFTITEFCERNSISKPQYFRMKARGKGPRTFKNGTRDRISREGEIDWIRRMEAENANSAAGSGEVHDDAEAAAASSSPITTLVPERTGAIATASADGDQSAK
jgi:hypothetical protein